MKIETKLNVEDECYFLFHNKVKTGEVKDIQISVLKEKMYIKYSILFNDCDKNEHKIYLEEDIFKTKQELLNSL
jgi:hypothetical protein